MQNRIDITNGCLKSYVFYCSNGPDAEQFISRYTGQNRNTVKTIGLPCAGKIDIPYLVKAFETGADAVAIVTCAQAKCLHIEGTARAQKRAEAVESLLEEVGLGKGRIAVIEIKEESIEQTLTEIKSFFDSVRKLPQPQTNQFN
jgi:coenzyme F420-reducing hydrogenase delta subunit